MCFRTWVLSPRVFVVVRRFVFIIRWPCPCVSEARSGLVLRGGAPIPFGLGSAWRNSGLAHGVHVQRVDLVYARRWVWEIQMRFLVDSGVVKSR